MRRVLVANRGEVALRIIRACREEGLEAVAVYSEADRLAPHVPAADLALCVGPGAASESYLRIDRLLDAARDSGADAVHPGYGFLAERADFAEAVERAGLTFVGPPAAAIAALGDKTAARRQMREVGVPVVPGTLEPVASVEAASRAAQGIGYPVFLKAVAGGGGKGMRVVGSPAELPPAFAAAQSEATQAFGDGRIYLERVLERPRHVEFQILGDRHGRIIHLGERECSVQRRHQKLIEEAPCSAVTPAIRRAMGEAAVRAARAVAYSSAGTCEFLLLPSGEFLFLEMNTRLQVEHPVTEMVYGVDLVRMQLKIAQGHHLSLPERGLTPRGCALECRITSEDPFADFAPAGGTVSYVRVPAGPGVRWDGWVEPGCEVPVFYDSLLGKLIVWGESRQRVIRRMRRALDELLIVGVPTSREFHQRVMVEPAFCRGEIDTEYWERIGRGLMERAADDQLIAAAAAAAALLEDERRSGSARRRSGGQNGGGGGTSLWLEAARREALRG